MTTLKRIKKILLTGYALVTLPILIPGGIIYGALTRLNQKTTTYQIVRHSDGTMEVRLKKRQLEKL